MNYKDVETSIGSGTVRELIVSADGSRFCKESPIVREYLLELFVNGTGQMNFACTEEFLEELVIGHLKAEGLIRSLEDVKELSIEEDQGIARVSIREGDVEPLKQLERADWEEEWIFRLANAFAAESKIHKSTKGTHCCYLSVKGEIVFSAEDIGRHNAMDKAIGYAVKNRLNLSDCILFSTGRAPTEIVRKAICAGIPVLATKAVVTDQGLRMANEYGLTLIGKAWPDSFVLYTM